MMSLYPLIITKILGHFLWVVCQWKINFEDNCLTRYLAAFKTNLVTCPQLESEVIGPTSFPSFSSNPLAPTELWNKLPCSPCASSCCSFSLLLILFIESPVFTCDFTVFWQCGAWEPQDQPTVWILDSSPYCKHLPKVGDTKQREMRPANDPLPGLAFSLSKKTSKNWTRNKLSTNASHNMGLPPSKKCISLRLILPSWPTDNHQCPLSLWAL